MIILLICAAILAVIGAGSIIFALYIVLNPKTVKLTGKIVNYKVIKQNIYLKQRIFVKGERLHFYQEFEYIDEDGSLKKYTSSELCYKENKPLKHMTFYKAGNGIYVVSKYELQIIALRGLALSIISTITLYVYYFVK